MGLTKYTLPDINYTAVGTIKCYLYVDNSLVAAEGGSITIPTAVNILKFGKFKEDIDVQQGVYNIENVDIDFMEDYSTYTDGFWYHIINTDAYRALNVEMQFNIVENGSETFLFRGSVFREGTTWNELYLDNIDSPTKWVRGHTIQFVSTINNLKNTSVADVITYVKANYAADNIIYWQQAPTGPGFSLKTATFNELFKAMLNVSYGSAGETVEVGQDFRVLDRNGISYSWIAMSFCLQIDRVNPGPLVDSVLIADTINGNVNNYSWKQRFASAYDLLVFLCSGFNAIPTLKYDSLGHPYMEILYRGHKGGISGFLTMSGKATKSQVTSLAQGQPVSFGGIDNFATDGTSYFATSMDALFQGQPLTSQNFDINISTDFIQAIYYSTVSGNDVWTPNGDWFGERYLYAATNFPITAVEVYDYNAGVYYNAGSSMTNQFPANAIYYLSRRFRKDRITWERTYDSLQSYNGSTTSQTNTKCFAGTQINDGVTTRNFYATAVEKDVMTNRATITWVQE